MPIRHCSIIRDWNRIQLTMTLPITNFTYSTTLKWTFSNILFSTQLQMKFEHSRTYLCGRFFLTYISLKWILLCLDKTKKFLKMYTDGLREIRTELRQHRKVKTEDSNLIIHQHNSDQLSKITELCSNRSSSSLTFSCGEMLLLLNIYTLQGNCPAGSQKWKYLVTFYSSEKKNTIRDIIWYCSIWFDSKCAQWLNLDLWLVNAVIDWSWVCLFIMFWHIKLN